MKKECCQKEENLFEYERRKDLLVLKCRECGCRHIELSVDPISLGIKLTEPEKPVFVKII